LQRLAIDHLSSLGSENLVRSQVVSSQDLQNLALRKDLRKEPSTWNLLPLTSDSFFDGPAQMVHDISWKIYLVERSKKVENQFVINAWLIRASTLLEEAFRHEFQEHPVLTFNVHQLGGGVSFQHHSFVAL